MAWILILGAGYMIEMFDNSVFSFLAPTIRAEWGLSLGQVGLITSAVFIGMMIGAIGGGRLSDHFGRKPVLIWGSVFYSLTSLMSALAPNFEVLFVSRVLTGVGVQATAGVIMVYISETFPNRARGRFISIVMLFGGLAAPLTAMCALAIAPSAAGAWRWVFVIGASGFVIAVLAAFALPESVRWMTANGRTPQADIIVTRMEAAASRRGELPPVEPEPEPEATPSGSYRDLLAPPYFRRMLVLGSAFAVFIFCLYGYGSWLTTVLVGRDLSQTEALRIASIATWGAVIAPVILFVVSDRIERKTAIFGAVTVAGAAMIVFGHTSTITTALIAATVISVAIQAATTSFYTYMPEIFPTHVRGVGAGMISGIARIAGIISGVSVAAIYGHLGAATLYLILGVAMFLVGVIAYAFGPRTTGRTLEEISSS